MPSIVAFALAAVAIVPFAYSAEPNPDEDQYAWSAAYHGRNVLAGRFQGHGTDLFIDPGFDPQSYWGRSMGTRWIYALPLSLPWVSAPAEPFSWVEQARQGPETRLDERSRHVLRLVGALCAALGAALLTWRFGWAGVLAVGAILVIPRNAENFGRAWAEGPLLLAFGLVAAAWGSRAFPIALGAASTVKLTAVGLWPLIAFRRAHGWRYRALALAVAVAVWVLLTPPSWHAYGPGLLFELADARVDEYSGGQASEGDSIFLPSRYLWPFELGLALLLLWAADRHLGRQRLFRSRPAGAPSADEARQSPRGRGRLRAGGDEENPVGDVDTTAMPLSK